FRWSIATDNRARATTARRKSSASWSPWATNAATSHEESNTFVSCKTTVDIERPRDGGAAMSCSQIAARHFSTSAASVGVTLASDSDFAGLLAALDALLAGSALVGAGSPMRARSDGDGLESAAPDLISATFSSSA